MRSVLETQMSEQATLYERYYHTEKVLSKDIIALVSFTTLFPTFAIE